MDPVKIYRGSCLCGRIRYEYGGRFGTPIFCHCAQCRKAQGTAFATNVPIEVAKLNIVAGEELLKAYESSPGKKRMFCSVCGSPLFSHRDDNPDVLRLRMGSLETPIDFKPVAHFFVASKAEWYDIHDDLPRFAERPYPRKN
jgi:hypothetical protein